MNRYSRREFLGTAAVGGAALALGLAGAHGETPAGTERDALRLVFFTDVHARTEWDTPKALQQAAAAINAQRPDIVIGGGDYITDGFQSSAETVEPRWDAYMAMHKAIEVPVHPVIGNHDLVAAILEDGTPPCDDPRAVFREKFGLERTYRSFDAGGYHLVLLDSIQVTSGSLKYVGMVWPEEIEWLKEDLRTVDPATPVVLVSHLPLMTGFYQATEGATARAPENRVVVNSRDVMALFEKRNLALVLQGHLHVYEVLKWRGTTFITGGAICGQWWRGAWHGTEEGFVVVTLKGSRVDCEYVDYGWSAERPAGQ
jgi:3',5'-cyclic-AMP phosphodiesterase